MKSKYSPFSNHRLIYIQMYIVLTIQMYIVLTKFLVPTVTRPTSAKLEGNLELDYRNIGLKWNPKPVAHLLEAFVHQV